MKNYLFIIKSQFTFENDSSIFRRKLFAKKILFSYLSQQNIVLLKIHSALWL